MDVRQLVQDIAREMLSLKIEPKPPKLLFIFCDSRAHEAYFDQFIMLDNHGISYDLIYLDGITSAWMGMHKIESTGSGAGKTIAIDEFAPAPIELPKEYDGVVIPEIDLDNASRIALGLKGSVKSEIVFAALLLEKPVWIGIDSPGVKRADRQTLKVLNLPKGYSKMFLKYMDELQELGIKLLSGQEFAKGAIRYFHENSPLDAIPVAEEQLESKSIVGLITADWVSAHAATLSSPLEVGPKTIISPLAKDLLRDKGIVLHYTEKG